MSEMGRSIGTGRAGPHPVRMDDVARHAGVSLGTVSHVLNHPEKVSPKTQQRVRRAIEELGFVPNRKARALAAGRSTIVGFVVADLGNSFFLDMARGARESAEAAGMDLLLADADRRKEREVAYMELLEEERVAGVLLAPLPTEADDVWAPGRWRPDVVLLNRDLGDGACRVTVDNELGGYLATRHLIESGRTRLVFAGGPHSFLPVADRYRGAQRAVAESGGGVALEVVASAELQVPDGRELGRRLLALPVGEMPDGVVAAADLLAVGITEALLSEGDLDVPRDVAVIGYDDNRASWDSVVPLSTIAQPGEELGRAGMQLLLEEIRGGEHDHRHVVLEPRLVVRSSSGGDR